MASGGDSSGGSWWGSFIKSAKEKSMSAIEVMKSDLAEFTTTMSNETSTLLNQATSQLTENTSSSTQSIFSNLTQTLSNNLNLNLNSDLSSNQNETPQSFSKFSNPHSTTTIHDRFKQDLKLLQSNETTFLNDPINIESNFSEWQKAFNPDEYKSDISDILIENSSLRLLYSQLVNQLEEEHKKRVKLLERATTNENDLREKKDQSCEWDDDETTENTKDQLESVKTEAVDEIVEAKIEEVNIELDPKQEIVQVEEKEKTEKPIEAKLKSEDSDDWEKVSDVQVNDAETDKKTTSQEFVTGSDQDDKLTQTNDKESANDRPESESGEKDAEKLRNEVLSKLETPETKPQANIDAEWDDWDE